ncbi:hypothetical protein [Alteribacter populi]|uniref:hypothetical protein n=1 Tax=Alteribacter populi TaxID=2011011 RepID=UPI000BBB5D89|nr:hypothetical protein [Alteribacter populi]
MARGYVLSHGENLQGNTSSFAKSLALDFERAKGAAAMVFLRRGTAGAAEDPAVSTPFANEEAEALPAESEAMEAAPFVFEF